ncbi:MAG: hypothetical protein JSW61_09870 [Candidatus Thorarchaeota archaeon]|nr:MAG: hypothetical protein JSW61_09870 [Candidatus Thorarchaeota archaeon]
MAWTEFLKEGVLDWILDPSDPSVRFWALQYLKGKKTDDKQVTDSQTELMKSPCVKAILGAQKAEGHWDDPNDMYLPKYTASTHSLLILSELGAKRTPAIEQGMEFVFSCQRDSGHFLTNVPKTERGRASKMTDGCCLDGNILYYAIHFGYLDDSRVQRLIQFLSDDHSEKNGGWRCRAFPIDPSKVFPANCYMGGFKALRGLSRIPSKKRSKTVKNIIETEVELILDNGIFRYLKNVDGSRKDKAGWKRFGFPLFYQSDILEVLDTLTHLGANDERMQDSIDLVISAMSEDGRWLLKHSFNGKMHCDIDVKGQPSKWITLRALRVLKRYYG